MKTSATLLLSLLMLPLLGGCAVDTPTSEEEYSTGAVLQINEPDPMPAATACEEACANYVNKCLTLVPNATQALFDEGQTSCVQECATWESSKTECIRDVLDCESMTDICGL